MWWRTTITKQNCVIDWPCPIELFVNTYKFLSHSFTHCYACLFPPFRSVCVPLTYENDKKTIISNNLKPFHPHQPSSFHLDTFAFSSQKQFVFRQITQRLVGLYSPLSLFHLSDVARPRFVIKHRINYSTTKNVNDSANQIMFISENNVLSDGISKV